jgi:hypothetical protein
VATGPVPLRTARGAGRFDVVERPFAPRLALDRRAEADAFDPVLLPDFELPVLRDAGGEDVRVAMLEIYGIVTPVPRFTRRTAAAALSGFDGPGASTTRIGRTS